MREYVSLDLETTGLEPKRDRIIEIGAAKIRDGQVQETYSLLVDPRVKIPERITDLTGISDQMVEGQPFVEEAVTGLLEFCEELPLLGHNLMFDYSFVKHSAVNMGLPFEKQGMDTLKIARVLPPGSGEQKSTESAPVLPDPSAGGPPGAGRCPDDLSPLRKAAGSVWGEITGAV